MNIVNVGSKLPYLFLFPAPPPRGGLRGPSLLPLWGMVFILLPLSRSPPEALPIEGELSEGLRGAFT